MSPSPPPAAATKGPDTDPKSRSRSPARKSTSLPSRRRSRSPPRRPRNNNNSSSFRWKQARRDDEADRSDDRQLNRGYGREGAARRDDRERERFGGRRDDRDRERHGNSDRPGFGDRRRDGRRDDRRDGQRDGRRDDQRDRDRRGPQDRPSKPKEKPATPAPVAAAGGEPMIIVTVNDRLGTKAQIPCLASDPVRVFKAMVAARIGRPAHEIMLKRQGERPFKDQLTLEDYGVSNGVQLDLELDTGD